MSLFYKIVGIVLLSFGITFTGDTFKNWKDYFKLPSYKESLNEIRNVSLDNVVEDEQLQEILDSIDLTVISKTANTWDNITEALINEEQ